MSAPFEFVAVDPASNPKPGKSLQIRRRCVQGKNKREGSRRSLQEKRRVAKEEEMALQQAHGPMKTTLPPLLEFSIGGLETVHFANPSLGSEAKGLVFRAFAYNVVDLDLSTLGRWLDFGTMEKVPFEWLFSDKAFLHTVLCVSYTASDFSTPGWDGKPGQKTLFHLRETLSLLQNKMGNQNAHLDETVLHVVINLALLSAMFGDFWASAVHYKGLQRIIQLRGNIDFLLTRPKLHFKLDRIDLALTLSSGKTPYFLHPTVSWDALMPAHYEPVVGLYTPPVTWNFKLRNIFQDLQYLTSVMNRAVLEHTKCNSPTFHSILSSLQSRICHLAQALDSPCEELVRFTVLAFLTTTFKAPGPKIPYNWAAEQLHEAFTEANSGLDIQDLSLRVWVLIIAAMTVGGAQIAWVREAWTLVGLGLDWMAVKSCLAQVMWIDAIHDGPARSRSSN